MVVNTIARRNDDRLNSATRRMVQAVVGPRTGIVRRIHFAELGDGDARLLHAASEVTNPHPDDPASSSSTAGGSGTTRDAAIQASLGEAIERFAGMSPDHRRFCLRSAVDLKKSGWDLDLFAAFCSQQRSSPGFPFSPVEAADHLTSVGGFRLHDGEPLDIPAFATCLYFRPPESEPLIAPGLSTGLACATTIEDALGRAICEVIERDSVTLTWLKGLTPPVIDRDWLYDVAAELLPPRDDVTAYDLTSDLGVPVVFIVGRGRGPAGTIISVGSACHPDPAAAARKAAIELSQDRIYVRQLLEREPDWRPSDDFGNVYDFSCSARLYSAAPQLAEPALNFLNGHSQSPRTPKSVDGIASLSAYRLLGPHLFNLGHLGAWTDLTPCGLESIGLHVVRVVIPSLMPLHGHHVLAFLGHPRLRAFQTAMPCAEKKHEFEIWPYPHPMP